MKKKAIFLDRDGTINIDKGYVYKINDFEFINKVPEALKKLKDKGYLLIVVTNQSGVARGYYKEVDIVNLHNFVNNILWKRFCVKIDKFYYCPHHENGIVNEYRIKCKCRKPNPGMILKAVKDYNIDLSLSYMIGDRDTDEIELSSLRFIKVSEKYTLIDVIDKII